MPFRPRLLPTAAVVVALVILLNLGFWQLRRHHEQTERLARVEERLYGEPLSSSDLDAAADDLAWHKASLRGTWRDAPPRLVAGRFEFGSPGYDLVEVLEVEGGPHLLVNRGWIPSEGWRDHVAATRVEGPVLVEGLLQPITGDTTLRPFPADDERPERWPMETASWMGIGASLVGPPMAAIAAEAGDVADVYLVTGPALDRGQSKKARPLPVSGYVPRPKEIGHLAYAVQWFLIASTLIVIWAGAAWRRGVRLRDAG